MSLQQTIAIIDDDPSITSIFDFILKQVGYGTLSALSAKQGLQAMRNNQNIDLMFLDAELPDMDCAALVKEILNINQTTKIILMADYTASNQPQDAYEAGAYGIIYKPFDVEEVLTIIKKIFAPPSSHE